MLGRLMLLSVHPMEQAGATAEEQGPHLLPLSPTERAPPKGQVVLGLLIQARSRHAGPMVRSRHSGPTPYTIYLNFSCHSFMKDLKFSSSICYWGSTVAGKVPEKPSGPLKGISTLPGDFQRVNALSSKTHFDLRCFTKTKNEHRASAGHGSQIPPCTPVFLKAYPHDHSFQNESRLEVQKLPNSRSHVVEFTNLCPVVPL